MSGSANTSVSDLLALAGEHGISVEQLGIVMDRGVVFGMPYHASLMRPLIRRGLFSRVERRGFRVWWALTDVGEALRARLNAGEGA